ncbi:hypothetical protein Goklo_007940, partial [Gossypium klotzschianum]|nr:hypothetical protein [Gossypium klotzschianum]
VRSNVDPTFYSLVGFERSEGDHYDSSRLDNLYIPYQCMESCLLSTALEKESIDSRPIGWTVGAMLYFMGKGDITQLVELRSCNWVVAIMSWVSNCIGGNDSILFSMDRTSTVIGVSDSSRFPHLEFLGKDQQKKGKPMDQPHRLHPVRTTRSPKDVINIQGSWIDHRTLFNKWNTLAVRSQVGQ